MSGQERCGWDGRVICGWWRGLGEGGLEVVEGGGRRGQEEPMEMQIASLNSIAGLSFDVN